MIKPQIIGREHLIAFVTGLKDFEKDKAIKRGLKRGGQVLSKGGKRRLKKSLIKPTSGTGNLLKSINVKVKKKKLGVLIGFRRPIGNHSHLLDRGTKDRHTKKGANRGKVKATAFWIDTKNNDIQEATDKVYSGIQEAVNKIKKRY